MMHEFGSLPCEAGRVSDRGAVRWHSLLVPHLMTHGRAPGWYAGTVTNVKEAIAWMSYTYMFVRMTRNPLAYGIAWSDLAVDPRLDAKR
jgi:hypothetical protein